MGWEVRRGKKYYYRKKRVDGRVHSIYFGSGAKAITAAWEDAHKQAEVKRQRDERNRLNLINSYKRSRAYKETLALLLKESEV